MSLLPKLARQDVFLFLLPGPIRQNHTLKGQMTSSHDLFENHTISNKVKGSNFYLFEMGFSVMTSNPSFCLISAAFSRRI